MMTPIKNTCTCLHQHLFQFPGQSCEICNGKFERNLALEGILEQSESKYDDQYFEELEAYLASNLQTAA